MFSFYHLQLNIFREKGVILVEEENFRLPVDVGGSKTSIGVSRSIGFVGEGLGLL